MPPDAEPNVGLLSIIEPSDTQAELSLACKNHGEGVPSAAVMVVGSTSADVVGTNPGSFTGLTGVPGPGSQAVSVGELFAHHRLALFSCQTCPFS